MFVFSLDENEDPVTGLERVVSFSNINAEERRQRRILSEQELAERQNAAFKDDDESALSARYESLDYEIVENQLYKAEENDPNHQQSLFQQSVNRWIVCLFIGIFTGCVAACIDITIYYSSRIKFHYMISNLLKLCEKQLDNGGGCVWMVEIAWICYNCGLVAISACLVLFVSPVAAASGIPQVKCFLNGVQIPGVVRLKTLLVKSFGVACSVGGGLSAGKEGPMIHSGAVIAAGISQGRCISFPIDFHIFKHFRNDREKRDFVSAGAAAGVAAAFGAPIGGVLFSLEEGASFWNQDLTWRMFFTAMISSFTVNLILSIFYGVSGFLSWTGLANFGVFENIEYNIWEIPIFLFIGVMGGILGALFNWISVRLLKFRRKYLTSRLQRLFECLLVAAVSAFTGFLTLFLVNDCQAVGVNPKLTELNKVLKFFCLWCRKGEYSAVANLFFQSPEESVKSLFHSPINSFRASTLLIFAVEYFILTLWTYGLSVPSGIFIPSLLTGAAWGRLVGIGVEYLFPNVTGVDPGKYALAGAAAQLGGIVRMTLSLTAIIMEATKDITFGLPIMLVLMISKWIGDIFNAGLYDSQIELNEVPLLGWNPPKMSRNILAERIMRKDVVAVEPVERVGRLMEILQTTRHHGFPVVDQINPPKENSEIPDYGHVKGLILRSQIITLLQNRTFSYDRNGERLVWGWKPIFLTDFTDRYPRYDNCLDKLELQPNDLNCWLDLRRYLHPHPHRVPLNASLQSVFTLFRGLGLRYLLVTDDENNVRGIITRKDIARFKEHRRSKKYSIREMFVSDFND
uniref:Chloride channel protein n=1 Tax=Syphacia muris TaxID=451379 RepID=A0A0N5AWK8_9BILA